MFSFGSAAPQTSLSLTTTTTAIAPIVAATTTASSVITAAKDLGGEGAVGNSSINSSKDPKDQPLPAELVAVVESFRNAIKDMKTIRDENNQPRFSMQPIVDTSNELEENLMIKLEKLDVVIQKNKKTIEVLKKETANLVADAETANRSVRAQGIDVNAGLYPFAPNRYTPSTSHAYFTKMVNQFEEQMKNYSQQIKDLTRHLENMSRVVSPADLMDAVRRQHEALITLASEIYAVHEHICRFNPVGSKISTAPTGATITIRHEGESRSDSEVRPSTKPIAFPTFVRNENSSTPVSKPDQTNSNRFPEAASLSSPLSLSAQALSPGNMSLGSPASVPVASPSLEQSLHANQSIIF